MPSVGKVIHTIRFTPALTWQPFGVVTATQAGKSRPPNRFESLASAELGGDLHVVVSSGYGLFHTIRFTNQLGWQPFGNAPKSPTGAQQQ